jgi:hypothetical protein
VKAIKKSASPNKQRFAEEGDPSMTGAFGSNFKGESSSPE